MPLSPPPFPSFQAHPQVSFALFLLSPPFSWRPPCSDPPPLKLTEFCKAREAPKAKANALPRSAARGKSPVIVRLPADSTLSLSASQSVSSTDWHRPSKSTISNTTLTASRIHPYSPSNNLQLDCLCSTSPTTIVFIEQPSPKLLSSNSIAVEINQSSHQMIPRFRSL